MTESGSLTLVADGLAWDGVPVEAQRRLQSQQEGQEREHAAAHGRCVSSHLAGAGVERWNDDGSISAAPGSLPRGGEEKSTRQLEATFQTPFRRLYHNPALSQPYLQLFFFPLLSRHDHTLKLR